MTSSKKKHHPAAASSPRPTPKATTRPAAVSVAKFTASRKQLIIRGVAVLGVLIGLAMVLIGATPDIAGGWGKLLLMVPGALIIAASCIVFVETTANARSLRIRR